MRDWRRWLVLALLLWAFSAMMFNVRSYSPTMDAQNHIARGYTLLRTGDPRLSIEHPPLINALEALPLFLLSPLRLPTDDWAWEVGEWYRFADLFLWQRGNPVEKIVFLARLPVVALTIVLAALTSRWARELWGALGGLFALALVTLDPNILAHGSLVTTDLGQTTTVLIAGYAAWRVARQPSWGAYLLTGLAMGAMLASKLSALLFFGVFVALLLGNAVIEARRAKALMPFVHRLVGIALIVLFAGVGVWAAYAFRCSPVVEGGAEVPLGTYWRGVRAIFAQAQGGRPSYLLGETSVHGWFSYFPITFAVKTPLATLAALLLAIPSMLKRKAWGANMFLLTPVLAYWAVVVQSALNLGYRHLLPTLPFLYIWAAQLLGFVGKPATWTSRLRRGARPPLSEERRRSFFGLRALNLKALLGLWLALTCVGIAPHFLAYFNALGGGPENGWRIVADSNIDWGQDLKRLREYLADHKLERVRLSWFGSSYPAFYGIDYDPLPGLPHHFDLWVDPPFDVQQPEPGIYVISVSNLVEIPFEDKRVFAYFRQREPDARVGYSIYVYKVPP